MRISIISLFFFFASFFFSNYVFGQLAISSFSPTKAAVGSTVTITGTGFSAVSANNTVYLGTVQAQILSATATSLQIIVPSGSAFLPFMITVNGLTAYSAMPFMQTFDTCGITNFADFDAHIDFPTGTNPQDVFAADVDLDGKPDVVTANLNASTVSVLRNTSIPGVISFDPKIDFVSSGRPISICMADFDGDGKLDIATVNNTSNAVAVMRNTGSPGSVSFAPAVYYPVNGAPQYITAGDVDLDGKVDIAVANVTPGVISVLKNTSSPGSISFTPKIDFTSGTDPKGVKIQDMDGDGRPEIISANYNGFTIAVLKNNSSPGIVSFAAPLQLSTAARPTGLFITDLDGDGQSDIAVSDYTSTQSLVSVFRNTSTPTLSFTSPTDYPTNNNGPWRTFVTDLNGDTRPDIMIVSYASSATGVSIRKNDCSPGVISFPSQFDKATGSFPESIFSLDIDGDERPDIITSNYVGNSISIIRNRIHVKPRINILLTTTCNGGTATVIVINNDAGPYTFSIDGINFQSSNVFTNLSGGIYTIIAKDATGCTAQKNITISANNGPAVSAVAGNTSCNNTASITATGSGGAPPYQYSIDNINFQNSNIFTAVPPGFYTVFLLDANGCRTQASGNITAYNFRIDVSSVNPSCGNSNGGITVNGSGGLSPYTYSLNTNSYQSNNVFNALAAGIYTVHIKDANSCVKDSVINLFAQCLNVSSSIINTSCNKHNGKITVTAENGVTPYQYSLDGISFQTSQVFNGLSSGNYTITVKDAANIVATSFVTLAAAPGPSALASAVNATCGNNDGSVLVNVVGGTPPILFSLGNGLFQNNPLFPALSKGQYTVTVKDLNGCSLSLPVIISMPRDCVTEIYFPNSFSPNNDAKNDHFKPVVFGKLENFKIEIYNRYGQKIFASVKASIGWDGTYLGQPQGAGVYIWTAFYKLKSFPNKMQTGSILLLR